MNAKDKEKDARIAELEAQLAEAVANANNNATEGEDAIAELTAQLKTMEQRYLDADGYCKKLDEDNTYLADQNEMLRNQVEGSKNDINELIEANAKLKAQNESYAIANEDLRFENMKNKGERDRIQMDYDKNVEVLKEVTDKNEAMQSEIFELKDKIKELESAVEYANSERARLTAELDKADEYIKIEEIQSGIATYIKLINNI
jgi:chromosome segregation ATPase